MTTKRTPSRLRLLPGVMWRGWWNPWIRRQNSPLGCRTRLKTTERLYGTARSSAPPNLHPAANRQFRRAAAPFKYFHNPITICFETKILTTLRLIYKLVESWSSFPDFRRDPDRNWSIVRSWSTGTRPVGRSKWKVSADASTCWELEIQWYASGQAVTSREFGLLALDGNSWPHRRFETGEADETILINQNYRI